MKVELRCPHCGATGTIDSNVRLGQSIVCTGCNRRFRVGETVSDIPVRLEVSSKNRLAFILLGLFLGYFGVHNFYAGYVGRGIAQLLMTVLSFGILVPVVFIWNIIEICVVDCDGRGEQMRN